MIAGNQSERDDDQHRGGCDGSLGMVCVLSW